MTKLIAVIFKFLFIAVFFALIGVGIYVAFFNPPANVSNVSIEITPSN